MRKGLLWLTLLFLILQWVQPVWANAGGQSVPVGSDTIINDIVVDFESFAALMHSRDGSIPNREEALNRLLPGFEAELATSIVDFFLQYDPESNSMMVTATDSIPIITAADRGFCQVNQLDAVTARLDRVYYDCYAPGDRWLYQVTAKKYERWKIADICLIPITLACFPSNP